MTLSHVQQDPTPDMAPDTLNALSSLMVAQGQEAIYRKAATSKYLKINPNENNTYADLILVKRVKAIQESKILVQIGKWR